MKKILVFSPMGIGNLILAIPLIEYLSNKFKVHVYIAEYNITIAKLFKKKFIEHIIVRSNFFADLQQIIKERYTEIYYTFPGRRNKDYLMIFLSGCRIRKGYQLPIYKKWSLYFLLNKRLKYEIEEYEAILNLKLANSNLDKNYINNNKKKYLINNQKSNSDILSIALHPGSDTGDIGKLKRWSISNWNQLIGKLNKGNNVSKIYVILGPKECDLEEKIEKETKVEFIKKTIDDVIDILLRCKLFIGNDGGIAHLAALCGISSFTLFGPVSYIKSHPLFNKDNIISKDLHCSPCQKLHKSTICNNTVFKECMDLIKPEEVLEKIQHEIE